MDRRDRLIARVREGFRKAYGAEPTHVFAAPGRVNLIGEHVDYNDGFVLPCAIDRETIVALGPPGETGEGARFEALALDMGDAEPAQDSFDPAAPITLGDSDWQNHVRGVVGALGRYGHRVTPARIAVAGDVPIGAGLSSSASFGVAVALACSEHSGLGLDAATLARVAQIAENDFVGCACGIMDQMASAASVEGHALLLDCRSLETVPVPIHPSLEVTVIDTGIRRSLTESAFNQRRAECEAVAAHFGVRALRDLDPAVFAKGEGDLDPVLRARARHVLGELRRVEPVATALANGDAARLAALLHEAHVSLSQDFDVSLPAIDRLAALVREALGDEGGVRLTGAGFGGCLVAVARREARGAIDAGIARYNETAEVRASAETFAPVGGAARIAAS